MVRQGEGAGTTFECTNAIYVSSQLQFTPSEAAELNCTSDCVESAGSYTQLSPIFYITISASVEVELLICACEFPISFCILVTVTSSFDAEASHCMKTPLPVSFHKLSFALL